MRKSVFFIFLFAVMALFPVSCRERHVVRVDSPEKVSFLEETECGLYVEGHPVFVYDRDRHQKASNPQRRQGRIQTNEQDTCLNVVLECIPESPEDGITAVLEYFGAASIRSEHLVVECSKVAGRKLWLWSAEDRTGIIMEI